MEKNNNWEKKFFVLRDRNCDLSKPWYVEYYIDGKRKQHKGQINNGKSIAERRELANELIKELSQNFRPPPPNSKIRIKLFETLELMAPYRSKRTVQDYRSHLVQLFNYFNGSKITAAKLELYFHAYRKSHAQTTTYQHRRKLNTIFKKAGFGYLLANIKLKKGKHRPLRYFQPEQDRRIMNHIRETDWMLYLYCGFTRFMAIRPRAETRMLRVCDIFFEEKKVCLRGEVTKSDENQYVRIPGVFYRDLERLRNEPPRHYIFSSIAFDNKMKPVGRNHYGTRFKRVLEHFGFGSDYNLYSLKHTLAAAFIRAGGTMFQLKHHFRHKDIKTTQLYLRQLGLEVLDDFVDRIPAPGEWGSEFNKRNQ